MSETGKYPGRDYFGQIIFETICLLLVFAVHVVNAQELQDKAEIYFEHLPSDGLKQSVYGFSSGAKIGDIKDFGVSAKIITEYFRTDTDSYFPDELYNLGATVEARSKKMRLSAGAASHSDRPFDTMHETEVSLNGTYKINLSDQSALHIGVNYSNLRQYLENIPLPIVIYEYKSKELYARLGMPFMFIKWSPREKISLDLSLYPILNGKMALSYKALEDLTLALEGASGRKYFLISEREDKDEKLFFESRKGGMRVTTTLFNALSLYGFIGYSFDGSYYKGERFNDKDDEVDVADSLIFNTGASYTF